MAVQEKSGSRVSEINLTEHTGEAVLTHDGPAEGLYTVPSDQLSIGETYRATVTRRPYFH